MVSSVLSPDILRWLQEAGVNTGKRNFPSMYSSGAAVAQIFRHWFPQISVPALDNCHSVSSRRENWLVLARILSTQLQIDVPASAVELIISTPSPDTSLLRQLYIHSKKGSSAASSPPPPPPSSGTAVKQKHFFEPTASSSIRKIDRTLTSSDTSVVSAARTDVLNQHYATQKAARAAIRIASTSAGGSPPGAKGRAAYARDTGVSTVLPHIPEVSVASASPALLSQRAAEVAAVAMGGIRAPREQESETASWANGVDAVALIGRIVTKCGYVDPSASSPAQLPDSYFHALAGATSGGSTLPSAVRSRVWSAISTQAGDIARIIVARGTVEAVSLFGVLHKCLASPSLLFDSDWTALTTFLSRLAVHIVDRVALRPDAPPTFAWDLCLQVVLPELVPALSQLKVRRGAVQVLLAFSAGTSPLAVLTAVEKALSTGLPPLPKAAAEVVSSATPTHVLLVCTAVIIAEAWPQLSSFPADFLEYCATCLQEALQSPAPAELLGSILVCTSLVERSQFSFFETSWASEKLLPTVRRVLSAPNGWHELEIAAIRFVAAACKASIQSASPFITSIVALTPLCVGDGVGPEVLCQSILALVSSAGMLATDSVSPNSVALAVTSALVSLPTDLRRCLLGLNDDVDLLCLLPTFEMVEPLRSNTSIILAGDSGAIVASCVQLAAAHVGQLRKLAAEQRADSPSLVQAANLFEIISVAAALSTLNGSSSSAEMWKGLLRNGLAAELLDVECLQGANSSPSDGGEAVQSVVELVRSIIVKLYIDFRGSDNVEAMEEENVLTQALPWLRGEAGRTRG